MVYSECGKWREEEKDVDDNDLFFAGRVRFYRVVRRKKKKVLFDRYDCFDRHLAAEDLLNDWERERERGEREEREREREREIERERDLCERSVYWSLSCEFAYLIDRYID